MAIRFPFDFKTADEAFANNEKGAHGFYPVGANNLWHGGIHLYSDQPVRAVYDGELVAYRMSSGYVKKKSDKKEEELSDCFMLLKHCYTTPKGQPINFYSLYMHLLPWDKYNTSSQSYPEFSYSSTYVVNTKEDGKGLNLRGEVDKSVIVAIIPLSALVKKLSDTPPSWPAPAGEPERYKQYRKVEYNGKTGFVFWGEGLFKQVHEAIYQLKDKLDKPDSPIAGTEGLNVRQNGSPNDAVLQVLPCGSRVYFKNEAGFKAAKNSNGYYQLDPAHHGPNAGWIFTKGNRIKEQRKAEKPVLDSIEKPAMVTKVKAGDILGYAGKWYADNVIHFEIFTDKIDFMHNPRKDVSSRPVYRLKKDVVFKERSFPEPEPTSKLPADSIAVKLTPDDKLNKYPYVKARQVSLQPCASLWVKRNEIGPGAGDFEAKDNAYKLVHDISYGFQNVNEKGEPDQNGKTAVIAKKGESLKFLDQKRGDYRLVRIKLKEGERTAVFALKDDLGVYKKPEYWIGTKTGSVYDLNPEIPQFKNDLTQRLDSDTEFEASAVEKMDALGEIWYGFKLPDTETTGWVTANNPNLKILDPFQWENFFETLKDATRNGVCDVKELIAKIEEVKGNQQDKLLSTSEIKNAVADPTTAKYLRRLVINDKTEWSADTDKAIRKWSYLSQKPWYLHPAVVEAKFVTFYQPFQWWDKVTPEVDPKNLCFFHPIAFLGHLGKLVVIIQKGDRGRVVEEINIRLAGFGGGVPADTFDDLTETKVKNFQRDYMKMSTPSGSIDENTAMAIDDFTSKYTIDFVGLQCPCGECDGFGKSINKGIYRDGKNDEGHNEYEYPGIHRSILWATRAMMFYAETEIKPPLKFVFSSGYRCSIDNKNKGRPTSNHKGKAVDIHIYEQISGEWSRGDSGTKGKLSNKIRTLFKDKADAQIDWIEKNKISLEPEDIAPTWVHADVRQYEGTFLDDRFFCKNQEGLNGERLLNLISKGGNA
jgi:hypothetical protein